MSEVQLFFVVLALLYGWECAIWLRRGSVGFLTWLGRSWKLRHPGALFGNQYGGFILAPPLPPMGTLLAASQFPLSLSPQAVLVYVATNVNPGWRPPQSGDCIRFDDIREVRADGKKVQVNGKTLLAARSVSSAQSLASCLQRLAKAPAEKRESLIAEAVAARLDSEAARRRLTELQMQSSLVRLLVNALFVYLFLLAPALIWWIGLKLTWLGLLAGLLALTTAIAVTFHRAHRALYPQAEEERFTHALTFALAPTTALRALDALSRPLFGDFHPLVAAQVLLGETQFQTYARRVLLDLRHPALPLCADDHPLGQETELYSRSAFLKGIEEFLNGHGVDPAGLCRAPLPADDECRAYCPRCGAQYRTRDGTCADCGGLALAAFSDGDEPGTQ